MITPLISVSDYATFPLEPELRFAALEELCRSRLMQNLDSDYQNQNADLIRTQYMSIVSAAARQLGVAGVIYPNHVTPALKLGDFIVQVDGVLTAIYLRSSHDPRQSVRLSIHSRGHIENQIQILRTIIDRADMSQARRSALLDRLDQLSAELREPRTNFSRVFTVLAAISLGVTAVSGATSFLADAPEAIATIAQLIGQDVQAEADELARLGGPPTQKALPAPSGRSVAANAPMFEPGSMDDDIPF